MIDRNIAKSIQTGSDESIFPCPHCTNGMLYIDKEHFLSIEDRSSKKAREDSFDPDIETPYDWEPDFLTGRFCGFLKCNSCNELVSTSGNIGIEDRYDEHNQYYVEVCYPLSISPAIKLINLPGSRDLDYEFRNIFTKAFELFWVDPSSCVLKLRIILEELLTMQGIPKEDDNGNTIWLHNRIIQFKSQNQELGQILEDLKVFGNVGAHTSRRIDREDLLDGFEVLEYVIFELYEPKKDRIQSLSNKLAQKYKK